MYRGSELSRTRKDPSGFPFSFISASSQFMGPQYQPHCSRTQEAGVKHSQNRPHWRVDPDGVVLSVGCDLYLLQLSQTGGEVAGFRPSQGAQRGGRGLSGRGRSICQ